MGTINWVDKCWVTTIYLVRDGKVLLTMNKNLNAWIPIGGHIDAGETPDEAIAREVAEETGFEFEFFPAPVTSKDGRTRTLKPYRIQIETVPHHNKHINVIFFGKCTQLTEAKTTDEEELLRWFSEEELHELKDELFESVYNGAIKALMTVE